MLQINAVMDDYHYDILLENGMAGRVGEYLQAALQPRRVLLVTDENVHALYGQRALRSIEAAGMAGELLCLKAQGYPSTLDALREVTQALDDADFASQDVMLVMGGGTLCDTASYAAWNNQRTVRMAHMPTTLIGMADWALAGKTALEYKSATRMFGSFFPPAITLIDPQTTGTMTDRAFMSGMAEVIKTACAGDATLFRMLEGLKGRESVQMRMEEIAWRCLSVKGGFAGADAGKALLGHHLAHAIETSQRYRGLTHGEAVAVGLTKTTARAEAVGAATRGTTQRLNDLLARFQLPTDAQVPDDTMRAAILSLGRSIDLPITERIGQCRMCAIDVAFLTQAWFFA